jgi:hypothetical protein
MNFLLEYNCGVFAYFSQMYGKALDHFIRIMKNSEDSELFLVIKSSFNCLQILVDNLYIEPAKILVKKTEELLPYLRKVRDLKRKYKQTSDEDTPSEKDDEEEKGLKVEYFSVSTASNFTQAANAPKNPCLLELEFFLLYFKTRISMHDCDEENRNKWLKKVSF